MSKLLLNEYPVEETLTPEQIRRALSGDFDGFKYFFENCMMLQDRDTRQYVHPLMNRGQELIARTILSYVAKDTRATVHKECVILGPRQFGKSTLLTAVASYIEAYVSGMENLNVVHTLQTGTTATKFFKQKIEPIVTNVNPAIYPTIERDTLGTSTLLKYTDVKGIRRGGYYEITSAGSNSVRSGTVSVWLCDEPSEYRNPEAVEDAISGAISSYGWSFTAYIGTFSDRLSGYFLDKIKTALDNPDDMELVFIPWFLVYGRKGDGVGIDESKYTEYDREVIIPEMAKYQVPKEEWNDKIGWYHRRALRTSKMKFEFPTSIEDILKLTSERRVFADELLSKQDDNLIAGTHYRMLTDNTTGKVEAHETEASPFIMYRKPLYGHRYRIAIDPITARSEDTDNFIMHVMDLSNNEQVATFAEKGLADEDYADWAVSIGQIYNNAELCPETNVANGFIVAVNARRYYHWYYEDKKSRMNKEPGIRTSISNKERMIDALTTLLTRENIIIHDVSTIEELGDMVKYVKTREDGTNTVRMAAKKGSHDDRVAALWIYAGSLDLRQIEGKSSQGWAIL